MPNNGRITLCPYYRNENKKSISCEDTFHRFRWAREKEKHMDNYCDRDWTACEWAASLNEVYEKEEDVSERLEEHKLQAIEKELRKTASMLGRAEKRLEDREKTIRELRRKKMMIEKEHMKLSKRLQEVKKEEQKAVEQIMAITAIYESRFAYLMDTYCDGILDDEDVEVWGEGKEFAVVADKTDDEGRVRTWKVVIQDETGGPVSTDEGASRAEADGAEETEEEV